MARAHVIGGDERGIRVAGEENFSESKLIFAHRELHRESTLSSERERFRGFLKDATEQEALELR